MHKLHIDSTNKVMQGSHNLIFMTMTDFFDGQQWLKSKYPKPNHPNHTNCFFVINKKIGHKNIKCR